VVRCATGSLAPRWQPSLTDCEGKGIKHLQDLAAFLSGGEAQAITSDLGSYSTISLTADFTELATVQTEAVANIWAMPGFEASRSTQLTQGRNFNNEPSWTLDGKLVYSSNMAGVLICI